MHKTKLLGRSDMVMNVISEQNRKSLHTIDEN